MGKFKPVIIVDLCKGCELCVKVCPISKLHERGARDKPVLRMSGRFNRQGYPYVEVVAGEYCTGCKLCELICPDMAIYVVPEG